MTIRDRAPLPIGLNVLLWTAHATEEHFPILGRLAELGYDGVEFFLGEGDAAHFGRLGAELDRLGLRRTVVTGLDPETNPVSPDPAVRAQAVERLRWAIEMAHTLGAETIGGPFHSAYKTFTGAAPTADEIAWSAETLRAVADEAQAAGVLLAVEALNRFECYLLNTAEQARALVDRVDHPSVRYHYDTHHAHYEEKDSPAAVRASAAHIGHMHISENDRGVPGEGQVAWAPTFDALRAIGYDSWLTIESFSRLDPEFAGAIHIWRDFFADPWDVAEGGLRFLQAARDELLSVEA